MKPLTPLPTVETMGYKNKWYNKMSQNHSPTVETVGYQNNCHENEIDELRSIAIFFETYLIRNSTNVNIHFYQAYSQQDYLIKLRLYQLWHKVVVHYWQSFPFQM